MVYHLYFKDLSNWCQASWQLHKAAKYGNTKGFCYTQDLKDWWSTAEHCGLIFTMLRNNTTLFPAGGNKIHIEFGSEAIQA